MRAASLGKMRMASGRMAVVKEARQRTYCDKCNGVIPRGGTFTERRIRTNHGSQASLNCTARCDPIAPPDYEMETTQGAAAGGRREWTVCAYCEQPRSTSKLRVRLDPRTLGIAHRMILCNACALDSGYSLPDYKRQNNLISQPLGMPRV